MRRHIDEEETGENERRAEDRRPRRPASSRSTQQRLWRWGSAVAAALVLGVALGLLFGLPPDGDERSPVVAGPVELLEPGEHRIAVAFESGRRLERVEFTIELPPGVELVGFPGQRTVRWQGHLAEGRSRLQLPLRVNTDARDGELVTRIMHEGGKRRLVVPVHTGADAASLRAARV